MLIISFSSDKQRKIINTPDFNYEFYVRVENKKINVEGGKMYFWFKSGEIHSTVGDYGGNVLEDDFEKFYKTNQLAEKGSFDSGLKVGVWKSWYENGILKEIIHYKDGLRHGYYGRFNSNGRRLDKGIYYKGLKKGKWIENTSDTIRYRKGSVKMPKDTTKSLFKSLRRIFSKKSNDSIGSYKKLKIKEVENDSLKEPFWEKVFRLFRNKKEMQQKDKR